MTQNTNKAVATLTAATAGASIAAMDNPFWRGAQIGINITALAGTTPSLTVIVEGLDEASGTYYPLLTSAALTATGFTLLTVYPGATVAANLAASQALPKAWRVRYTIAGATPAVTATIGAGLIL